MSQTADVADCELISRRHYPPPAAITPSKDGLRSAATNIRLICPSIGWPGVRVADDMVVAWCSVAGGARETANLTNEIRKIVNNERIDGR